MNILLFNKSFFHLCNLANRYLQYLKIVSRFSLISITNIKTPREIGCGFFIILYEFFFIIYCFLKWLVIFALALQNIELELSKVTQDYPFKHCNSQRTYPIRNLSLQYPNFILSELGCCVKWIISSFL